MIKSRSNAACVAWFHNEVAPSVNKKEICRRVISDFILLVKRSFVRFETRMAPQVASVAQLLLLVSHSLHFLVSSRKTKNKKRAAHPSACEQTRLLRTKRGRQILPVEHEKQKWIS